MKISSLHILVLLYSALIGSPGTHGDMIKVDCMDSNLNLACTCFYDCAPKSFKMLCSENLVDSSNTLPHIDVKALQVSNGFTQWPVSNRSFYNATTIDFSKNKIDAVGDLSNFLNVQSFNLSSNIISKLNPDLCKLKDLTMLDLSHNSLETIEMDYFVCNNSSMSSLKMLYLNGNVIKSLHKLDLLFVALPLMVEFDVSNNQLDIISIDSVSTNSINFLNNMNKTPNKQTLVDRINSAVGFKYLFNNNLITNVSFSFELIYNSVTSVLPVSDNLLVKFTSVNLKSNSILCDCNLFKDINFILQGPFSESPYYSNLTETSLFATQCLNSKSKYSMASMMINKKLKLCPNTTTASNTITSISSASNTTTKSATSTQALTTASLSSASTLASNGKNISNIQTSTTSTTAAMKQNHSDVTTSAPTTAIPNTTTTTTQKPSSEATTTASITTTATMDPHTQSSSHNQGSISRMNYFFGFALISFVFINKHF